VAEAPPNCCVALRVCLVAIGLAGTFAGREFQMRSRSRELRLVVGQAACFESPITRMRESKLGFRGISKLAGFFRIAVGCTVKLNKSFVLAALACSMGMTSCYHEFPGGGGGGGGGGGTGTAKVSFTVVADTPPANLGIVSFVATIQSITLTSSTGAATTLNLNGNSGLSFDLARLQSDSGFAGTAASVPTGANSTITVKFSSAKLVFQNNTGVALTTPTCPSGDICVATFGGPLTATINAAQTISGNTGFGIDVNLSNALTVSGSALALNLTNASTTSVSSFTLPRANSNLLAGQLDLIEDVTGVVSLSGSGVTVTPALITGQPTIAAASNSNTIYDLDPTNALCQNATTLSTCVTSNAPASMDAVLNADGTFTVQEIEPLSATLQDSVEGTIYSIPSQTQFGMIVTNIIPAASNSKISSISIGDPLTVNLAVGPTFLVDSKGLPVQTDFSSSYQFFIGSTNTTGLQPGQTVAIPITSFTAANGNTPAISNQTAAVTLRWSRFGSTPTGALSNSLINVTDLPSYFGLTSTSILEVEIFPGTQGQGSRGITNLDGIPDGSAPNATPGVGIRALYIEDPGGTLAPAFFAAKVRQQ